MKPDLYIYFDIDPIIGLARKGEQDPSERNHFEDRKIDFHERQRAGCKEFMNHVPHEVIDASQRIDKVWEDFKAMIEKKIKDR